MNQSPGRAALLLLTAVLALGVVWWAGRGGDQAPPPLRFAEQDLEPVRPGVDPDDPWAPPAAAAPRETLPAGARADLAFRGRVVDPAGSPVPGAIVRWALLDAGGRALRLKTTLATGRDGAFACAGSVPPHPRLVLVVQHGSFATAVAERTLVGGAGIDLGDIVLAGGGELLGRVVDGDYAPVMDATVSLRPAGTNPLTRVRAWHDLLPTLATDARGRFRAARLPAGEYRLQCWATGLQRGGPDGVIRIRDGETLDLGDLALARGYRMAGIVLGPDGAPRADAEVRVRNAPTAGRGILVRAFTRTGPEGRFELDHLPSRPLRVEVAAEGCLTWSREPVDVTAGGELRIELEAGLSLAGRVLDAVTGQAVTRFTVTVRAADPDLEDPAGPAAPAPAGLPAPADHPEGRFTATGLDAGHYAVEVQAPGYAFARHPPIALRPRDPAPEVEIRLARGLALGGTVVGARDGAGIPGAQVELRRPPATPPPPTVALPQVIDPVASTDGVLLRFTTTDARGAFRFTDLPPGHVQVVARHPGYVAAWSVPVALHADRDDLRLELTSPATLHGQVHGDGRAGTVHVVAYGGVGNLRLIRVQADTEYRLEGLAPGDYLVRAFAGDPRDYLVSRIRPATDALGAPSPPDVRLAPGEVRELSLAVQVPALGGLSGQVRGGSGPMSGGRVTLVPLLPADPSHPRFIGRHFSADVGEEGRFGFEKVPAGRYGLQYVSGRGPNATQSAKGTVMIVPDAIQECLIAL